VEGPKSASSLWQISIMGGSPCKLIDDGRQPSVSRQGSQIAFVRGPNLDESLWLMQSNGENPRPLLVEQKTMFGMPAWSPEGRRIAYVAGSYLPDLFEVRTSIEIYDLDSGGRQTVLSAVPEAPPPPLPAVPAGPPRDKGVTASRRGNRK
jgi:dipeptidyl aminopeptidase/acylaminoacyl peptidase